MLKKVIEYKNFNGEPRTVLLRFNITTTELLSLQTSFGSNLRNELITMIEKKDLAGLIGFIKELVLRSYGVLSEDGDRFVKSEELKKEFESSAAFETLLITLIKDANLAVGFFMAVIPEEFRSQSGNLDGMNDEQIRAELVKLRASD